MKYLNNKGYMLVEIVLASVIAMTIAYFIMDLTIQLKNKNDDLLVKTLVATDQAIIYNAIMEDVYNGTFRCSDLSVSGKKFTYNGFTNIVSDYVTEFSKEKCIDQTDLYDINIKLRVKQLPGEEFDVNVCYGNDCSI